MFKVFSLSTALFLFAATVKPLFAQPKIAVNPEHITHWYQFTFENDAMTVLNKSDDGYSNGIAFSWGHADYESFSSLKMPSWLRYISAWTYINQADRKQYAISYGLSQSIYTPDNIEESELNEADRPYAGTLLWHSKIRSYANNSSDSLGLTLGVVGPASLAEQSQTVIHTMIDATIPEGWDNQIDNEFLLRIEGGHIERFYRYPFSDNFIFDTSSYSELGVGNLRSDIGTGLTLRIGNMLDQSYESINPMRSASLSGVSGLAKNKFYWQAFSAIYASYLFNDITLNGNTFKDSHSVQFIHERLLVSFGISALYNRWGAVFSIQRANKEFEGQKNISKFGSLTISYYY